MTNEAASASVMASNFVCRKDIVCCNEMKKVFSFPATASEFSKKNTQTPDVEMKAKLTSATIPPPFWYI